MRALLKNPSDDKFRQVVVLNDLHALQELVGGGNIDAVTLAMDTCLLCNEEGVLKGLEPNCVYMGKPILGPILLVGVDGEEFTDCPWSVTMANKGISK